MTDFTSVDEDLERIRSALGAMSSKPRPLLMYLQKPGPDFESVPADKTESLIELLLSSDDNNPARLLFANLLRSWDNAKQPAWSEGESRNSAARRALIHRLLELREELARRVDVSVPFFQIEEPLLIAEKHTDWYSPQPGVNDYYWSTYRNYLRERRGWNEKSLITLENSTRAIVECLANPAQEEAYASRGLVVGYVQSGKTANFTGVVARAADAGYRLIIVLAGTWNILREQTQRRFDKELLGKELLSNDAKYAESRPADWDEFLEHGSDPSSLGHYSWQRLTGTERDFKRLKAAIDNLEFERLFKDTPLYDKRNLYRLPVKLLVIKKNSSVLKNLVRDLKLVRTKLTELPTLIIDDESDHAGLNTKDPRKPLADGSKDRNPTNQILVKLLAMFPRGQYVGYTATPYANAFVDPDDPKDLFPKDFLLPLARPIGYMGISDFFDPETDFADLDSSDFRLPEIAHIRRIEQPQGQDDEILKQALASYVFAGALKLFRRDRDPLRYGLGLVRHHTMLIHTAVRTVQHGDIANRVRDLWNECAFNTPKGLTLLEQIWVSDHQKVIAAKSEELAPKNLAELRPFLSEALKKIASGPDVFLVVNSDKGDVPDFSASPVWKLIIGGNKLSRGYTIEGLTVSYYRRVSRTAETLMQMGRWFGFRPGYADLVRVYLGVREGKSGTEDLVASFKEVCRMEENFRDQLERYRRRPGLSRITPKDIPPLVSITGSIPPTSRRKMYNADRVRKNFGGKLSSLTLAPTKNAAMAANRNAMEELLSSADSLGDHVLGGTLAGGRKVKLRAKAWKASNKQMEQFLMAYHWIEADFKHPQRPPDAQLQLEFLSKQKHGIRGWSIVAPQRIDSFGNEWALPDKTRLAVKNRGRTGGRGFQVFGEPDHRIVADYLAHVNSKRSRLVLASRDTAALQDASFGVCLLYLVRESPDDAVSVGFELLFPHNDLPFEISFQAQSGRRRR